MAKEPKEHVKKHLEKTGSTPATALARAIDALNAFSDGELEGSTSSAQALMSRHRAERPDQRISAVH